MKFYILFQAFTVAVIAKEYSNDSYDISSPSPQSKGAFAFEPENVQKIVTGSVPVVTVEIPDKTSLKYAYPNLKLVNDSSELINDQEEPIAPNGTLISGVHSRYRGRSMRSYQTPYQSMRMPYHQYPNGMYYGGGGRYRYNRFDDRNSMDSGDTSSSWGSNWFNKLKRRTSMMMNPSPMTMSSYDKQMMNQGQGTAEEPDMSATFLGGWGAPSHYGKAGVNKSAVGLLGFLSLLSLIQNVLNQTSTTGGRRRRDLEEVTLLGENKYEVNGDEWDQYENETAHVVSLILPMLNDVSKAELGLIPVECVLQSICQANKVLVNSLGENGRVLGIILGESTSKTLRRAAAKWKSNVVDISEKVIRAGKTGRIGKNCEEKFKKYHKGCKRPSPNSEFDLKTILDFMENLSSDQTEDFDISQYFQS